MGLNAARKTAHVLEWTSAPTEREQYIATLCGVEGFFQAWREGDPTHFTCKTCIRIAAKRDEHWSLAAAVALGRGLPDQFSAHKRRDIAQSLSEAKASRVSGSLASALGALRVADGSRHSGAGAPVTSAPYAGLTASSSPRVTHAAHGAHASPRTGPTAPVYAGPPPSRSVGGSVVAGGGFAHAASGFGGARVEYDDEGMDVSYPTSGTPRSAPRTSVGGRTASGTPSIGRGTGGPAPMLGGGAARTASPAGPVPAAARTSPAAPVPAPARTSPAVPVPGSVYVHPTSNKGHVLRQDCLKSHCGQLLGTLTPWDQVTAYEPCRGACAAHFH